MTSSRSAPRWSRRRSQPRSAQSFRTPPQKQRPKGSDTQRLRYLMLALAFVILVVTVTHRIAPDTGTRAVMDTEGFAPETIVADFRFQTVDLEATREAQEAAVASVPDTYRVDQSLVQDRLHQFEQQVEYIRDSKNEIEAQIRQALLDSHSGQTARRVVREALTGYAETLADESPFEGVDEPDDLVPWLMPDMDTVPSRVFAEVETDDHAHVEHLEEPDAPFELAHVDRLYEWGRRALHYTLAYGIWGGHETTEASRASGEDSAGPTSREIVVLRDHPVGEQQRSVQFSPNEAPTVQRARQRLRDRIRTAAQDLADDDLNATANLTELQDAAFEVARLDLGDTLVFDPVTTEDQQEAARRQVEPVTKWIEKNQPIQEGARRWTEQSRLDYETYLNLKMGGYEQRRTTLASLIGNAVLVGIILVGLARMMKLLTRDAPERELNTLALALLVITSTLVVGRIAYYFDPSGFVVPVAAAAILLAILVNTRIAATTTLLMCLLLSIQYDYDWRLLFVSTAMSFAGLLSIYKVRKRSDMGRAAMRAAAVGILAILAVTLATDSVVLDAPSRVLKIALNGLICLFLVPGLLPPLERLFGITTDIQLLEYSDLNNELLSRLAIEVPATYAHSLMLGQLAEAASDAIGANGLMARVCAYYHDIGKLKRPEYFSENQTGGNVHDSMAPRMSARAIASHVTEGAEMARGFHLPKPIVDAIYEHHGTCKISFFHQQAVAQQKHGDVREEDFRYPGPRPQSRETAILMICDAVESAVRSLKNPNEERVRELVDKIINSRAEDRQFDECDLTLRDLDTIEEIVSKRILSTLHRRVAYPDAPKGEKPAEESLAAASGGGEA